jgi:energy-coupling factor transporter ATP-binding protein EcfA2
MQERYMVDVFSAIREGNTTPCIDGILETQLGHHADYNELYFWVLVMLGRFLFPLDPKKYDNWEKMLCFFGNGGCGKSTLLNAIKSLIAPVDLGTLSMNAQETFGLASLIGPNQKQLKCLIYEVTGKFKIPPQQFQSMMSADSMNINRKNQECYSTDAWHEHVIMAGNAKPAWQDLGGALSRRLMPIYMRNDIVVKDGNIGKRIQAHEIGAFLFKIVTAYHYARRLYGTKDPYDADPYDSAVPRGRKIAPQTILKFSETIKKDMSPLWSLITQGLNTCASPLELDPDFYITKDDFVKQYNDYLARHFKACDAPFTADLYEPVFPKFGIKVKLETRADPADPDGPLVTTEWIQGIGIRANYMSQINEKAEKAKQAELDDVVAELQADSSIIDSPRTGPRTNGPGAKPSAGPGAGPGADLGINYYEIDDGSAGDDNDDEPASSSQQQQNRQAGGGSKNALGDESDAHWVTTVLAALKKNATGSSQDAVALTKTRFQRLLRSLPIKFRYDALADVVAEMDPPGSAQEANAVLQQVFFKMDVQTSK